MSVRRKGRLAALLLGCCGVVLAADAEAPEMDFIEYLGMWEESDEVWLALAEDEEQLAEDSDERSDPVPQGEESTENGDES